MTERVIDGEDLWRRVGLEELRRELAQVSELTQDFERALRLLPSCNQCARVALLEQIHGAGKALSRQAMNLAILAESLKEVVAVAEQAQAALAANAPAPCQCPRGRCACHE